MRRACVIGWPVEHSRSPLIHGYWLEQYGIDGAYEKQAVRPEALARFLGSLGAQGYAGANVTLPHKEAALKLAAVADEAARRSAPPIRCGSISPGGSAPAIPTPMALSPISTKRRLAGTMDAGR